MTDVTQTWHCFARQLHKQNKDTKKKNVHVSTDTPTWVAYRVVWCQGCDLRTAAHTFTLALLQHPSHWMQFKFKLNYLDETNHDLEDHIWKLLWTEMQENIDIYFFLKAQLSCGLIEEATSCWFVLFLVPWFWSCLLFLDYITFSK